MTNKERIVEECLGIDTSPIVVTKETVEFVQKPRIGVREVWDEKEYEKYRKKIIDTPLP
jgi:hypothetical protein